MMDWASLHQNAESCIGQHVASPRTGFASGAEFNLKAGVAAYSPSDHIIISFKNNNLKA